MIPDDVVEEVRARADIVDVIGEFVSLKRSGKDYKAQCPFHEDRTPSFYVVPAKSFYNCFGCGESGDVFSFVMKRMGYDFPEAVKHVGRRSGVEVKEVTSRGAGEDPNRPLHEANAFAREFYRERLEDPEGGREARAYLESRGVDRDTAERYSLGYAPDEWRALRDAASRHGMDDPLLLEVGLLTESDRAKEPYDRFRGRIVFPIETVSGRVVAFGGRLMNPDTPGPKYLNSPESPVYHKGEILYGLSWAKHAIRREDAAVLVEGYMDVVSVAGAGVEHVVAPLGTSVTGEQARLLSRYTRRAFLLFDSDPAGLRATFRAADVLLAAGIHPSVATLPAGEDPDSVARAEGEEGLREILDGAVDVLDRKLQILEERDYFSSASTVRDAVDRLLPTLRAAADPALRDIYVSKVSERTGVRRETLEAELSRAGRGEAPDPTSPSGSSRRRRRPPGGAKAPLAGMGAERELLRLLLRDPEGSWVERAGEHLSPDDFVDPACRELFRAILEDPGLDRVPEGLDPGAARRLEQLLAEDREIPHARRVFDACVGRIRHKPLAERYREIQSLLESAEGEERRDALLADLKKIAEERREVGPDWGSAAEKALRAGTRTQPPGERSHRTRNESHP